MKTPRSRYERLFHLSLTLFIIASMFALVLVTMHAETEGELNDIKEQLTNAIAENQELRSSIVTACESGDNDNVDICSESTFKSWMSYTAITDTTSDQWQLQQEAITDENYGFRMIDGYILVAMGEQYGPVGTKYIVQFEDEKVVKVMIGDIKHEGCTSSADGSMIEFIIDPDYLPDSIKTSGNFNDLFTGQIEEIRAVE